MPYQHLGARSAQGFSDPANLTAPGNWTVAFTPQILNVTQTEFECYKMIVTGGAPRATFNVYVDQYLWDTAIYAPNNSWDPTQPLPIRFGQTLYFYYSDAATDGFQPNVTIWLRYELALPFFGGGGGR